LYSGYSSQWLLLLYIGDWNGWEWVEMDMWLWIGAALHTFIGCGAAAYTWDKGVNQLGHSTLWAVVPAFLFGVGWPFVLGIAIVAQADQ
jgi:hypothetical protein